MRRGVVFDRDGTLIDVVRDEETGAVVTAFHPDHVHLLPGAVEGLLALQREGYAIAIATNQPGPAKGHFSAAAVTRTNAALVARLAEHGVVVSHVAVCMHHPGGAPHGDASLIGPCACRKPLPGLVDEVVESLSLDRASSWMVGDAQSDVAAGRAAGLNTALVFSADRCELCPLRNGVEVGADRADVCVPDLARFASALLAGRGVRV